MWSKYIGFFNKLVQIITLKKVIIWALAGTVGVLGYTIFENSKTVYSLITGETYKTNNVLFKISEPSRIVLKKFVDELPIISSLIILNVDIRHNQRIPIYWYSSDTIIQRTLNANYADRIVRIPAFSSNEKNNAEIVSMLNGEFTCNRNAEIINIIASAADKFTYLCSMSLPPYYGQFSGYMIITLKTLPDRSTLDLIKLEMTTVATDVYLRDIQPFNRVGGKL